MSQKSWIESNFTKRECVYFVPVSKEPHRCLPGCQICQQLLRRCHCGRLARQHGGIGMDQGAQLLDRSQDEEQSSKLEKWSVEKNTVEQPTDAYGVLNFQGGSHSYRAKYVRLSHTSQPELVLQLLLREWQMKLPKMVISVHGGVQNFNLHPRIKQVVGKGLVRAAASTGTWILTEGLNTGKDEPQPFFKIVKFGHAFPGVAKHVGDALKEYSSRSSRKLCTIGIAPWGVIENWEDLIGRDVVAPYQTLLAPLSKLDVLNSMHSHFLLVDDGTVGRHGAEISLRREIERHINLQRIHARIGQGVPVVVLIVEGGPSVILTMLEYLQECPPVPVVVCEGTGRAADILAHVYKQTEEGGGLPDGVETEVIATIKKTFSLSRSDAVHLFQTLMECMKYKDVISVFSVESEENQDIDVAILRAWLKGNSSYSFRSYIFQNDKFATKDQRCASTGTDTSPFDQLALTLAWNRADIAKKHVFGFGQRLLVSSLEQALLDALAMDRVEFVKLLVENGVSMHRFLTIARLEELYNTKQSAASNTLFHLVRDVKKRRLPPNYKITLIDVGLVIEHLMGGTYRCTYTRKWFRILYNELQGNSRRTGRVSSRVRSQRKETQETFCIQAERKERSRHNQFIKTAQPYKCKLDESIEQYERKIHAAPGCAADAEKGRFRYPFSELLVWAVLMKRRKMSLFLWQHGEEAMAKALVACKLCRAMAIAAKTSTVVDDTADELKECSNEFGLLAVDLLEQAYREDETMAMKLLTYELKNWSSSTCLKLAVTSRLRALVAHTCTQLLLSDMWMGQLNMRKNSWYKVILSILMPPAILLLEFKSKAEMAHIPQTPADHQMIMEDSENKFVSPPDHIELDVFKDVGPGYDLESEHETEVHVRPKGLPITRKFYAFYHAPIVKFWFNTMAYLGFLMLYSYVVLVKVTPLETPQEWIVTLYIFTSAIEKIRAMLLSEAGKISQKVRVWFSDYFNVSDSLGILTFLFGFGFRCWPDPDAHYAGRLLYCLNIVFWYIRLLDILAVNQKAGPYVMMIAKMVANMFYIVVIMGLVLVSFGVPRLAILYPEKEPSWTLLKDVVFQPYWMMYGEVYATEIDVCATGSTMKELCHTGVWLTPFLQAVYLFVQYIIMVNLLIAVFNNVYVNVESMSNLVWKYQRYHFIMAYHDRPVLPPPLISLNHLISLLCCYWRRSHKGKQAHGPKLFLSDEDQRKLHDFEERCVQTYFREKNERLHSSEEERIKVTSQRVENMCVQLKDIGSRVNFVKRTLQTLDAQIGHLQDLSALTVDTVKTLAAQQASGGDHVHQQLAFHLSATKQPDFGSESTRLSRGLSMGAALQHMVGQGEDLSINSNPKDQTVVASEPGPTRTASSTGLRWRGQAVTGAADTQRTGSLPRVYPLPERFLTPSQLSPEQDIQPQSPGVEIRTFAAVERNNLLRLSQSIPFTPVAPRGDLVTVYQLEESSAGNLSHSMSSWGQQGCSARLEFLSKEEMGGGLRRAVKALCTWSEGPAVIPGRLYIIKSFQPEVVESWRRVYQKETVLRLCLMEIQQQRAAQKLASAFNKTKPKSIPYSPRFLEVLLLYSHTAEEWFTVEECIVGEFRKFNNNNGDEMVPTNVLEESMLAFTHWSYEYTRGELLVLDLQGVGEILTDPSVIKNGKKGSSDMVFGPANLGDRAMRSYRAKHRCNLCCRELRLPDIKRNSYTPHKVKPAQDGQLGSTVIPKSDVPGDMSIFDSVELE
ncbi:transient receptor potential cation channel subfamily M member 7-like [Arapaima gigas]